MLPVENPFKTYTGLNGQPLDRGYVYFGTPNLNPITNQIQVYWDADGTQPAEQPLRTVDGYIMRGGTPANVYTNAPYSELVLDRKERQVAYARNSEDFSVAAVVQALIDSLATLDGADLMGWQQDGVNAVLQTVAQKLYSVTRNLWDFLSDAKRATLRAGTYTNVTTELQTALDSFTSKGTIEWFGNIEITSTIFLKRSGMRLISRGIGNNFCRYVNAGGGTAFAGATSNMATITDCEISGFSITGNVAGTDPAICVDLTTFAYSRFDLSVQTKRVNGACYYGQGNNGSSPYYNWITGCWFGGSDMSQIGLHFAQGLFAGGSNGGNANFIGPIQRAAALGDMIRIDAGNGNECRSINGESINNAYFRLGDNAAVESGTSSGSNTMTSLKDTAKAWAVNAFVGYGVKITGGTGAGQTRLIRNNQATNLNLRNAWGIKPDATSTYELYKNSVGRIKIIGFRGEGLDSLNPDFMFLGPGTEHVTLDGTSVESLGSGLTIRDASGATTNVFSDGKSTILQRTITNPGPSANIDLFDRNSVFGGLLMSDYNLEWVMGACTTATPGDIWTVKIDVGGTATGNGDATLTIISDEDTGCALPGPTEKIKRDGLNRHIFGNLTTGAAFSATADIVVTLCVTADQ